MPAYCSAVSNSHLGTASGSAELSNRRAANGVPGHGPFASPQVPDEWPGPHSFLFGAQAWRTSGQGTADRGEHRQAAGAVERPSNVGSVMISKRGPPRLSRSDYALV